MKLKKITTKTTKMFSAKVVRTIEEDVGALASSEQEAKKKILALYKEKEIDVHHISFVQKKDESCDKNAEEPASELSTPK